jgi:hypothetical protein
MKKVLVIGMLDSIHLARWLSQFEDQSIMFTIYPSRKFKLVHSDIFELVKKHKNFNFAEKRFIYFYGYREIFLNHYLSRVSKRFSSAARLAKIIGKNDFDYIHVVEIQGAGYLLLDSQFDRSKQNLKVIVTNWGSDIYFFEKNPVDKAKVKLVLRLADYYSAECYRDYELALKNGFAGKFLPINPNAGGFKEEVIRKNIKVSNERNQIIVKCYGGELGLGDLIISALDDYLNLNTSYSVFFYSVTSDLEPMLKSLILKYPKRISFTTIRKRLSVSDIYEKFADSRIYIGASKSDGISTSFLEALTLGAYPIQTNTSCGNEWVEKGFQAHLVEPTKTAILEALLCLDQLPSLDEMRLTNKVLATKFLNFESIKRDSIKFYGAL